MPGRWTNTQLDCTAANFNDNGSCAGDTTNREHTMPVGPSRTAQRWICLYTTVALDRQCATPAKLLIDTLQPTPEAKSRLSWRASSVRSVLVSKVHLRGQI